MSDESPNDLADQLKIEHMVEELLPLVKIIRSGVFHLVIDKVAPNISSLCLEDHLIPLLGSPTIKWTVLPVSVLSAMSLPKMLAQQGSGVIQIENFEEILVSKEIGRLINQQRDQLSKYPITLILSILDEGDNFVAIPKAIPDLWSIIGFTLELQRDQLMGEREGRVYPPSRFWLEPQTLLTRKRRYRLLIDAREEPFYANQIAAQIGLHYYGLDQFKLAIRWLRRAYEGFAALGEIAYSLETLNALAWVYASSGDLIAALELWRHAGSLVMSNPDNLDMASWTYKILMNWRYLSPETYARYASHLQQNNLPTP
jgi:tetratricopeptide (TPR) repeat protein